MNINDKSEHKNCPDMQQINLNPFDNLSEISKINKINDLSERIRSLLCFLSKAKVQVFENNSPALSTRGRIIIEELRNKSDIAFKLRLLSAVLRIIKTPLEFEIECSDDENYRVYKEFSNGDVSTLKLNERNYFDTPANLPNYQIIFKP